MTTTNLTAASPLERAFANMIDALLLLILSSMLLSLIGGVATTEGEVAMPSSGLLVVFLANVGYFTGFTSSRWQASPGQRILSLRVIRTDGRNLSQEDALGRYLAFFLPSVPLYASFLSQQVASVLFIWLSLMWLIPILLSPQRIGVHDRLSGTRVIARRG